MKDEVTFFLNNFIIQNSFQRQKPICTSMPCNHDNGTTIDLHNPSNIGLHDLACQCYAICMNATKYL